MAAMDLSTNVVIGQGATAQATATYLYSKGYEVSILSNQPNQLPNHLKALYVKYATYPSIYWISPGIRLDDDLIKSLKPSVNQILDVDYFVRQTQAKVIFVTGTNGKSTVCLYLKCLLNQAGFSAEIYGNFQPGLLQALDTEYDWVIIELSSFQLARLSNCRVAGGIITNIISDHIDWHGSLDAYKHIKKRLIGLCEICVAPGIANALCYHDKVRRFIVNGYRTIEAENMAAASMLLSELGVACDIPRKPPSLPYRFAQVSYQPLIINDSKATNLHATVAALTGVLHKYTKKVLLIMAGMSKNDVYTELESLLQKYEVDLVIVGDGHAALDDYTLNRVNSLDDLLYYFEMYSVILFSPGGSSYDQYKDYLARGAAFDRVVKKILART